MEMLRTHQLHEISLFKIYDQRWSSKQPTGYSYGWIGTRCHTTINYRLEQGKARFYDGLSRTDGCNKTTGKCNTPTETILWDPVSLKRQCPYQSLGMKIAHLSERFVTIPEMQTVFVRKRIPQNRSTIMMNCQFREVETMENGIILDHSPSTNDQAKEADRITTGRTLFVERLPNEIIRRGTAINANLQYLWNTLVNQERQVIQEVRHRVCEDQNRLLRLVKAISQTDPTTAARILFKRNDIAAENVGSFLKVFPC
ncbi:unnamed protein product [Anisakis simplex]|uniref:FLYWCH-type domain-containing protein n=1 Tax=Anisakis simplex TaxID=6269 RepID=A0A0M3IZG7_ANISI|nr:unnamed protein product [Anisakis simplex]